MPHRNRVTPYGEMVATPERGTLTGNRGVLHGDDGEHRRDWQVRGWIACRLEFEGRHREIRRPGRWTELFFLDEATALAAGHRPCAECRRADHRRWQAAWPHADTGADAMDRVLHADRLDGRAKRTYEAGSASCPAASSSSATAARASWTAACCGRGGWPATGSPSVPARARR